MFDHTYSFWEKEPKALSFWKKKQKHASLKVSFSIIDIHDRQKG